MHACDGTPAFLTYYTAGSAWSPPDRICHARAYRFGCLPALSTNLCAALALTFVCRNGLMQRNSITRSIQAEGYTCSLHAM